MFELEFKYFKQIKCLMDSFCKLNTSKAEKIDLYIEITKEEVSLLARSLNKVTINHIAFPKSFFSKYNIDLRNYGTDGFFSKLNPFSFFESFKLMEMGENIIWNIDEEKITFRQKYFEKKLGLLILKESPAPFLQENEANGFPKYDNDKIIDFKILNPKVLKALVEKFLNESSYKISFKLEQKDKKNIFLLYEENIDNVIEYKDVYFDENFTLGPQNKAIFTYPKKELFQALNLLNEDNDFLLKINKYGNLLISNKTLIPENNETILTKSIVLCSSDF